MSEITKDLNLDSFSDEEQKQLIKESDYDYDSDSSVILSSSEIEKIKKIMANDENFKEKYSNFTNKTISSYFYGIIHRNSIFYETGTNRSTNRQNIEDLIKIETESHFGL